MTLTRRQNTQESETNVIDKMLQSNMGNMKQLNPNSALSTAAEATTTTARGI